MTIKKKFLMAVSKDASHQYGVRFLSYFFQNKDDIQVDILNISHHGIKSGYYSAKQSKASSQQSQDFLQEVRQKMMDFGFPDQNIQMETRQGSVSTASDILATGRKGMYDALILGRRGLTLLESLIQDSVSGKILDEQCDIPVWICREPERRKKHLLLCTDGSEESLNAADHAGFILESAPENNITVLYVRPPDSRGNEQSILDSTVARLTDNNIAGERISTLVLEGKNAARLILDHARDNSFAAIAMGRKCRQESRKGLSGFFVGSVSSVVLKNLEQASLWICK